MSRSRSSSITAVTANGTAVRGALSRTSSKQNLAVPEARKNLPQRVSNSVIGVKGSFLKDGGRMREVEENPMARLKLLIVSTLSSFLLPFRVRPRLFNTGLFHVSVLRSAWGVATQGHTAFAPSVSCVSFTATGPDATPFCVHQRRLLRVQQAQL